MHLGTMSAALLDAKGGIVFLVYSVHSTSGIDSVSLFVGVEEYPFMCSFITFHIFKTTYYCSY